MKKAFTRNDTARYVDWVNLGKNRTGNQFVLDRDELNEHLNSLNIDTESYKKSDLDKMEKNSSQDVILDKKSKDNNLDLG